MPPEARVRVERVLARPEDVRGDEVDLEEDPDDDEARRHEDGPLEAALGAGAHRADDSTHALAGSLRTWIVAPSRSATPGRWVMTATGARRPARRSTPASACSSDSASRVEKPSSRKRQSRRPLDSAATSAEARAPGPGSPGSARRPRASPPAAARSPRRRSTTAIGSALGAARSGRRRRSAPAGAPTRPRRGARGSGRAGSAGRRWPAGRVATWWCSRARRAPPPAAASAEAPRRRGRRLQPRPARARRRRAPRASRRTAGSTWSGLVDAESPARAASPPRLLGARGGLPARPRARVRPRRARARCRAARAAAAISSSARGVVAGRLEPPALGRPRRGRPQRGDRAPLQARRAPPRAPRRGLGRGRAPPPPPRRRPPRRARASAIAAAERRHRVVRGRPRPRGRRGPRRARARPRARARALGVAPRGRLRAPLASRRASGLGAQGGDRRAPRGGLRVGAVPAAGAMPARAGPPRRSRASCAAAGRPRPLGGRGVRGHRRPRRRRRGARERRLGAGQLRAARPGARRPPRRTRGTVRPAPGRRGSRPPGRAAGRAPRARAPRRAPPPAAARRAARVRERSPRAPRIAALRRPRRLAAVEPRRRRGRPRRPPRAERRRAPPRRAVQRRPPARRQRALARGQLGGQPLGALRPARAARPGRPPPPPWRSRAASRAARAPDVRLAPSAPARASGLLHGAPRRGEARRAGPPRLPGSGRSRPPPRRRRVARPARAGLLGVTAPAARRPAAGARPRRDRPPPRARRGRRPPRAPGVVRAAGAPRRPRAGRPRPARPPRRPGPPRARPPASATPNSSRRIASRSRGLAVRNSAKRPCASSTALVKARKLIPTTVVEPGADGLGARDRLDRGAAVVGQPLEQQPRLGRRGPVAARRPARPRPRAANVRRTSPCSRPRVRRSLGVPCSGVRPKMAKAIASSSEVLPAPVSPVMTTSSCGRRSMVCRS